MCNLPLKTFEYETCWFHKIFHKSHMALLSSEHLQTHRSTSGIFTGAYGNNREVTTEYRGYPKCLWTFDLHDFIRCKIHLITNDNNQTLNVLIWYSDQLCYIVLIYDTIDNVEVLHVIKHFQPCDDGKLFIDQHHMT